VFDDLRFLLAACWRREMLACRVPEPKRLANGVGVNQKADIHCRFMKSYILVMNMIVRQVNAK
jgi:hypothetical protein